MKASIHPNYYPIKVTCSCGFSFETRSTRNQDLSVEICAECHPFYTGKQKLIDTAGRIQQFQNRYKRPQSKSEDKSGA